MCHDLIFHQRNIGDKDGCFSLPPPTPFLELPCELDTVPLNMTSSYGANPALTLLQHCLGTEGQRVLGTLKMEPIADAPWRF